MADSNRQQNVGAITDNEGKILIDIEDKLNRWGTCSKI